MEKKDKPKSLLIFCDKHGEWKGKLEKLLQTDEKITLLALGNVKFDVLRLIHRRRDIEIVKLETRFMKKREKGTGVKVTVRRRMQAEPLQK
jgi:hypothetical protein